MPPLPALLRDLATDLLGCLRFYTRLPVPVLAFESAPHAMPDFRRVIRMLPLAGALVGAIGALVLWAATALGLSSVIAALMSVSTLVAATGAFHEDGLADTADGFGGGASIARKLEIMKDSRIGTYGGAALVLSLLARVLLTAEILALSGPAATTALIVAVAGGSRLVALMPLVLLPPARTDGAAFAAARPGAPALLVGACLALALWLWPLLAGVPAARILVGLCLMTAASACVTMLARRQIQGQTGDVAGAAQQMGEIACLCAFASHAAL